MAISQTGVFRDTVGGKEYPLKLRNGEIERFEMQHAPLGLYELFDQLAGNGPAPQVRHVRDIVALGLVGGFMDASTTAPSLAPREPLRCLSPLPKSFSAPISSSTTRLSVRATWKLIRAGRFDLSPLARICG